MVIATVTVLWKNHVKGLQECLMPGKWWQTVTTSLQGTAINCRERLEYEANGAQKPECTVST